MRTDVPCCCVNCGMMYSAKERLKEEEQDRYDTAEQFSASMPGRRFEGQMCEGSHCHSTMYRLLMGPLFVPRD